MKEEIRILYSQYFQLAETIYLKKSGATKKQVEWLKKETSSNKIVGQYHYYEKQELADKKEVIKKIISPIKQMKFEQIEECVFYIFTIKEIKNKNLYDMEESLWLHLWNCVYLDAIRQMIGRLEMRIPKLSLGPGFYHIDMETADILYELLEGKQYGIKIENHMFKPIYTCCGVLLYGDKIKSLKKKPCETCKAVNHCEFCIYL